MRVSDLKPGTYFKLATDPRVLRLLAYDNGMFAVDAENNLVGLHPDSWVEPAEPTDLSLDFTIRHANGKALAGMVVVCDHSLEIYFDGYGRHGLEDGAPLAIEPDKSGCPLVVAFTEVYSADPTHRLSFDSARVF